MKETESNNRIPVSDGVADKEEGGDQEVAVNARARARARAPNIPARPTRPSVSVILWLPQARSHVLPNLQLPHSFSVRA